MVFAWDGVMIVEATQYLASFQLYSTMELLKLSLCISALLISTYKVYCDTVTSPDPTLTETNLFVYVPYLQDALKWEISDTMRNLSDAETAKQHLDLVKARLDDNPLLAAANSLMCTTLKIYIDVVSGQTEIDSIVSNHVEHELDSVLKNEEPENAQKVKQAFVELITPAMKKVKSADENSTLAEDVVEAMYSASVTAEVSLKDKNGFKLFRVALAAWPGATEEEVAGLAENTPKPGDKIPLFRPHEAEE